MSITDYLKENGWHEILSMDKNEVLLFIAERLDQITMMGQGRYSGRITREEQKLYQEAWSYIDPKAKVCFTCGRTPQLMSVALLNYYQCQQENALTENGDGETETASTPPKRKRRKRGSQSKSKEDYMETIAISKVRPNSDNPRYIKDEKFKKLVKSLRDFPEMANVRPIVVNKEMIVLGGNMRLKAMQEAGWKEVPVQVVDWSEEKQREFIIKDNVGFGEWDWDELANTWDAEELNEWGLDTPDNWKAEELEAEEDDYEVPEELKTDVVLGDLIEIGEHRLLCGDSTDSDQVAKLMNGEKADMVLSDPPYGMFLDADYSSLNWGNRKGKKYENVIGDHEDFDPKLIDTFFKHFDYCKEMFLWGADYYFELLPEFKKGNYIVWDKTLQSNGDAGSNSEYELCWSRQKHKRVVLHFNWFRYFGLQTQDTKTRLHPTQKPLEVNNHFIENYSKEKDKIIDLFLGSGSTMVAAHQLNRKCYGMELDPKYCQVIIDRMTKLDPTLSVKINGKEYVKTAEQQP